MEPQVEAFVKKNEKTVALRKVNIERWGSPVAKQIGMRSIPYFIVCDPQGKVVDKGGPELFLKYQSLIANIKK